VKTKPKNIAKLVMIDPDGQYLLMHRGPHPVFGIDPDIPGGTGEPGESLLQTLLREVQEETAVSLSPELAKLVSQTSSYSPQGNNYALFVANLERRPNIVISWEHSRYQWIERSLFLSQAARAADPYMHMVADVLSKLG
jgi:8-oxo-dGTP pyrophosphatase MutT (NUDIX family)